MDINNPLTDMVNSIVKEIQERVTADIDGIMLKRIQETIDNFDFTPIVDEVTRSSIKTVVEQIEIPTINVENIEKSLELTAHQTMSNIVQNTESIVQETVTKTMEEAKIGEYIQTELEQRINYELSNKTFLPNSINASAINWTGHRLSGDHISGGIIQEFSSIGIDDKATNCQLTVMDNVVVVEPPMITTGVEVRGNLVARGLGVHMIEVTGEIVGNAVTKLGETAANKAKASMIRDGIDTTEIRIAGQSVLNSSELGSTVLSSSLRKVGTLQNLQTSGETSLSETLYAYRNRIGINTIEPGHTFTVWDGETEFVIEKCSQNRVFAGTHRSQAITISSGGKTNLSLEPDGSVTINDLKLGAVTISTASQTPNWSGHTGELVFNDSPRVGSPSFWCCLGGTRWAIGAIISE